MSHLHAPDSLLICPYDKNHKIQAYKMQAHMVKCKKSHPELDKALETCPFNALHKYLGCDKDKHIKACPDKERVIRAVQGIIFTLKSLFKYKLKIVLNTKMILDLFVLDLM